MRADLEGERLRGWIELEEFTGMSKHLLARQIGLYGFPKPQMLRESKTLTQTWSRVEVRFWINQNWDLYNQLRRKAGQ